MPIATGTTTSAIRVDRRRLLEALNRIKLVIPNNTCKPILQGVRGQPPVDHDVLVELLMTVSELVEAYPEIEEMDLNPVIARPDGLSVVDVRVLLRRNGRT